MGMQDLDRLPCVDHAAEARGDLIHGLIPGDLDEAAGALHANPPQGAGEAKRRIAPGAVMGDGAPAAELAARNGVVGIAQNFGDDPVLFIYGETAGVVAITRGKWFSQCPLAASSALACLKRR
jgi:hypothetical protein